MGRGMDPRARILVVDDEVRSARILARMLREDGFIVELGIDGAVAIGRLARPPTPDVLITELQVPHVGGVAIARYARSLRPGLPIIVVTGYPELVPRHHGELDPAPTVLDKPLDYARLSAELRRVTQPAGSPAVAGGVVAARAP
jgi:two-component system response regulator MprA